MKKGLYSSFPARVLLYGGCLAVSFFSTAGWSMEVNEGSNPITSPLEMAEPDEPHDSIVEGEIKATAETYSASLRLSGATLKPRESNVEWSGAGGGGCISASSGSTLSVFNVPVTLPNGSEIFYFRMYYKDTNNSTNSRSWFTVYDLYGATVEEWGVDSSGDSGNGYVTTEKFKHTVDYSKYSYVINWRPNELGLDMQVCGFRVYYAPPESTVQTKSVFFPIVGRETK